MVDQFIALNDSRKSYGQEPKTVALAVVRGLMGIQDLRGNNQWYGRDIFLLLDVNVKSLQPARHYDLPVNEYTQAMLLGLEDL